ncbi:hypothetical protein CWI39_3756p0010, partial [Hamiltosporidium magnivora]
DNNNTNNTKDNNNDNNNNDNNTNNTKDNNNTNNTKDNNNTNTHTNNTNDSLVSRYCVKGNLMVYDPLLLKKISYYILKDLRGVLNYSILSNNDNFFMIFVNKFIVREEIVMYCKCCGCLECRVLDVERCGCVGVGGGVDSGVDSGVGDSGVDSSRYGDKYYSDKGSNKGSNNNNILNNTKDNNNNNNKDNNILNTPTITPTINTNTPFVISSIPCYFPLNIKYSLGVLDCYNYNKSTFNIQMVIPGILRVLSGSEWVLRVYKNKNSNNMSLICFESNKSVRIKIRSGKKYVILCRDGCVDVVGVFGIDKCYDSFMIPIWINNKDIDLNS